MSSTFTADTVLCYGKNNDLIDELAANVEDRLVYDPVNDAWLFGEWDDDE